MRNVLLYFSVFLIFHGQEKCNTSLDHCFNYIPIELGSSLEDCKKIMSLQPVLNSTDYNYKLALEPYHSVIEEIDGVSLWLVGTHVLNFDDSDKLDKVKIIINWSGVKIQKDFKVLIRGIKKHFISCLDDMNLPEEFQKNFHSDQKMGKHRVKIKFFENTPNFNRMEFEIKLERLK